MALLDSAIEIMIFPCIGESSTLSQKADEERPITNGRNSNVSVL